jgi:hypothetical protein
MSQPIRSKAFARRAEALCKDESMTLTPDEVKHLLGTVLADEKSVRVFCRTLLACDIAEAQSGNDDADRVFVNAAMRVAYVWASMPANAIRVVMPMLNGDGLVPPTPDGA